MFPKSYGMVPLKLLPLRSSSVKLEVTLNTHSNILDDEKVLYESSRIVREVEKFNGEGDKERR
jgi:hypothetical protein